MPLKEVFLEIDNLETEGAPLYVLRPTAVGPLGAYVTLAIDGEVRAQVETTVDAAETTHDLLIVWDVPANVRGTALLDRLESNECLALLDRVHSGHRISERSGVRMGEFTRDARAARISIMELLGAWDAEHLVRCESAGRFLRSGFGTTFAETWPPAMTLDEAVAHIQQRAASIGDLQLVGDVKTALLLATRNALIAGAPVRQFQRQALLEYGVIKPEALAIRPEDAQCAAKSDFWIVKHLGPFRFQINAAGRDGAGELHSESWITGSIPSAISSANAWVKRHKLLPVIGRDAQTEADQAVDVSGTKPDCVPAIA